MIQSNLCSLLDDVLFMDGLAFSKTLLNHILQLLQLHGFNWSACSPGYSPTKNILHMK